MFGIHLRLPQGIPAAHGKTAHLSGTPLENSQSRWKFRVMKRDVFHKFLPPAEIRGRASRGASPNVSTQSGGVPAWPHGAHRPPYADKRWSWRWKHARNCPAQSAGRPAGPSYATPPCGATSAPTRWPVPRPGFPTRGRARRRSAAIPNTSFSTRCSAPRDKGFSLPMIGCFDAN